MRAIRLRCPNCGDRSIVVRWLKMRSKCPACGMRVDRGEADYFLGSMMFNLIAAEGLFALAMLGAIVVTWPDPPWDALLYGGAILMAGAPFAFYPFSKTLWLAFDLIFRPTTDPEEAVPEPRSYTSPRVRSSPPPPGA